MAVKFNTNDASFLSSVGDARGFAGFGGLPQAALSGRSNVGKSSLINCLLGRKSLARVSSVPGKTITVNYYKVGGKMLFVDLPGYGFAKRPAAEREKWSRLTDGFFTKNPASDSLKLVLQLIDAAVGPTPDDMMMVNYLRDAGVPRVIVLTKTGKPSARRALLSHVGSRAVGRDAHPLLSPDRRGKRRRMAADPLDSRSLNG